MEAILLFLLNIAISQCCPYQQQSPLIIAHRGSSGMLPEHTVEAYKLAVEQGADIIECDVAVSKDLQLLCTHESWLNATTNVNSHAEFQNRIRTYYIPYLGINMTDYFTIDFTLKELKSLKRVQVNSFRDQLYNGKYPMASLDDYISVAKDDANPKTIKIYVETKNPAFFNIYLKKFGTNMEDMLLKALQEHGYTNETSPSFIESFSLESLRYMSKFTQIPLVFLTKTPVSEAQFADASGFISVICPRKDMIVKIDPVSNHIIGETDFMKRARKYGLKVHSFTFANEYQFLAYDYGADPYREYEHFINIGLDGIFTDFPWSLHNYLQMKQTREILPDKVNYSKAKTKMPGDWLS